MLIILTQIMPPPAPFPVVTSLPFSHFLFVSNILYIPYELAALQPFVRVFSLLLLLVEPFLLCSVSPSLPVSICDVVFDFHFYVAANPVRLKMF